jgi:hypothetical protein
VLEHLRAINVEVLAQLKPAACITDQAGQLALVRRARVGNLGRNVKLQTGEAAAGCLSVSRAPRCPTRNTRLPVTGPRMMRLT